VQLFTCQNCGNLIYFENTACESCGWRLGYDPDQGTMVAMAPPDRTPDDAEPAGLRFCDNAKEDACNWLVSDPGDHTLCRACRYNLTIPDLSVGDNRQRWRRIELAKHRLIYTLLKLGLRAPTREENPQDGLGFEFLADPKAPGAAKVMTGHDDGLITLSLREADDAERTTLREAMGEPYRTLLGHFRHESGHYFWDRLVRDGGQLDACRAVFGDDSQDYQPALERHYRDGAPADWREHYISAYASSHPWEDFAETWAHYLHIVDTLDTAVAFGVRVRPRIQHAPEMEARLECDPYTVASAHDLVDAWLPLTYAVNSLNRSMGQPDLYPFVLTPAVLEKLDYIHSLVRNASGAGSDAPAVREAEKV
jgi:hypothetical protein